MNTGFYISSAGAFMQSQKMDQVTNNLANLDTPGFKRDFMTFSVRLEEAYEDSHLPRDRKYKLDGGGLLIKETETDFSQGPLQNTNRPLDLALATDDAFFRVKDTKTGDMFYTRTGAFTLDKRGKVVLFNQRFELMDRSDQPFMFDIEEDAEYSFKDDGTLVVNGIDLPGKRIGVYEIKNADDLQKKGRTVFEYNGPEDGITLLSKKDISMKMGFLEKAGIDASQEFANMILTQRLFDANINLMTKQDETLQQAIRDIASFR